MNKKYKRSLFVFRQDLRVHDNTALRYCIAESEAVMPVFIFDTAVLKNFPADDQRLGFLCDAVKHLEIEIAKR